MSKKRSYWKREAWNCQLKLFYKKQRLVIDGIMMNLIISFFAMLSIFLGIVSMVTPIPGGTVLIAGGLTALICSSPSARYCLMWLRSKMSWFNKLFCWLENKVGSKLGVVGSALSKTRPPENMDISISHSQFVKNERNK